MTIREIIYSIQSLYEKGTPSDDSRLRARQVWAKLRSARSLALSKKLKSKKLSEFSYTTLPCVELVQTDLHECGCIPVDGCQAYRSVHKIPQSLDIDAVTTLDGNIEFSPTTWKAKKYKGYSKWTSKKPDYFLKNDYLYLTSNNLLTVVSITGVWEDPVVAYTFPSYCDTEGGGPGDGVSNCTPPLDREFPIDPELTDIVREIAIKELIGVMPGQTEDIQANSKNE